MPRPDYFFGLTSKAYDRVELSPAIVSDRPAAISLPGEFDRAFAFWSGRDMEAGRIFGGREREEGATIAYAFRNALVAYGVIYAGEVCEIIRTDGPRILLHGRAEQRGTGLLVSNRNTEDYFGDWLLEAPGRCLLAEQMGVPAICFEHKPWLHEAGYEALLDVSAEPVRHARFETLWIVDDRGINDGRAGRLRELRRRLRAKVRNDAAPRRVYLARGVLGRGRNIGNTPAVEAALSALGFEIVYPERETPMSLARQLVSAHTVVTVEGSTQVHAILAMADRGVLVALQPPDRFAGAGKEMADMAGLRYAYMVGDPAEGGFTIDLDRLHRTIALAEETQA